MRKIVAIIVTYNAVPWLERCLGSLQASSVPVQTVIVDNRSTDETVNTIRTRYPQTVLIENQENLGFGQANNIGIRYALEHEVTHVLLLNQDAWIEPKMIENLLVYDDLQSLLSPIHLTGEGDRLDTNFEHCALRRSPAYDQYLSDQAAGKTNRYPTCEINAACWLIPRAVLEEIGGFSPLFFHYAEDTDYLQRLHFHGKGVYFVSGTYCYHDRAHAPKKIPTAQSIYQQLVLRAVDINCSRFRCWIHRVRYCLAVWHTALAEHRLKDICLLAQAKRMYCAHHKTIRNNRKEIQHKAAHWLR